MEKNRLENLSVSVLFIGITILLLYVFRPFIPLLLLAVVFAILLHKPYEKVVRKLGGHSSIAAVVTVTLTFIFIIVPLFFLGAQVLQEAQNVYLNVNENGAQYLSTLQESVQGPLRHLSPTSIFNINTYLTNSLVFISNNLGSLAYGTVFLIFETFLMMLALFFFLRDGRSISAALVGASPLGREMSSEMLNRMYLTIGSVMKGTVLNALIRFGLIWFAFSLFNIPNAILWSSVGGIVGAIPGLGTPFAFIPAVLFVYLHGSALGAIGLAVFGIAVVVLVDNILTSYFFARGLAVSPLFVLFSILGGVFAFGPVGFIIGPLVLSVFLSVIHAYRVAERH